MKESPQQTATPQNFKSSALQTTKAAHEIGTINFDTAKTSTKSQQGFIGGPRRTITAQNSNIQGRKVDSPKICVHEGEIIDYRPKTASA